MSPGLSELQAPASWQRVEFISDLHLSESDPLTFASWQRYIEACTADALFILGDLFEAWIGDDVLLAHDGFAFEKKCAQVISSACQQRPVYFLHGNRDFLLGDAFFKATGMQPLADPCVLVLGQERLLLSHGDALCVNDLAYMQLRAMIRTPQWCQSTLAKPLQERVLIAAHIKMDKAQRQEAMAAWMDVDGAAASQSLHERHASTLVHGHTHRPGEHKLPTGGRRMVLSDWDGRSSPARAQVLRWQNGLWHRLQPQEAR